MKKVVYSVSRTNRYGSTKMTGLGFITESDLIIACNGRGCSMRSARSKSRPQTAAAKARDMRRERSKSSIPSGTSSWIEEAGL